MTTIKTELLEQLKMVDKQIEQLEEMREAIFQRLDTIPVVCPYHETYDNQKDVELVLCDECQEILYQQELQEEAMMEMQMADMSWIEEQELREIGVLLHKPRKPDPIYCDLEEELQEI